MPDPIEQQRQQPEQNTLSEEERTQFITQLQELNSTLESNGTVSALQLQTIRSNLTRLSADVNESMQGNLRRLRQNVANRLADSRRQGVENATHNALENLDTAIGEHYIRSDMPSTNETLRPFLQTGEVALNRYRVLWRTSPWTAAGVAAGIAVGGILLWKAIKAIPSAVTHGLAATGGFIGGIFSRGLYDMISSAIPDHIRSAIRETVIGALPVSMQPFVRQWLAGEDTLSAEQTKKREEALGKQQNITTDTIGAAGDRVRFPNPADGARPAIAQINREITMINELLPSVSAERQAPLTERRRIITLDRERLTKDLSADEQKKLQEDLQKQTKQVDEKTKRLEQETKRAQQVKTNTEQMVKTIPSGATLEITDQRLRAADQIVNPDLLFLGERNLRVAGQTVQLRRMREGQGREYYGLSINGQRYRIDVLGFNAGERLTSAQLFTYNNVQYIHFNGPEHIYIPFTQLERIVQAGAVANPGAQINVNNVDFFAPGTSGDPNPLLFEATNANGQTVRIVRNGNRLGVFQTPATITLVRMQITPPAAPPNPPPPQNP